MKVPVDFGERKVEIEVPDSAVVAESTQPAALPKTMAASGATSRRVIEKVMSAVGII